MASLVVVLMVLLTTPSGSLHMTSLVVLLMLLFRSLHVTSLVVLLVVLLVTPLDSLVMSTPGTAGASFSVVVQVAVC